MASIIITGDKKILEGIAQLNLGRVRKGMITISEITSEVEKKEDKGQIENKEEKKTRITKGKK